MDYRETLPGDDLPKQMEKVPRACKAIIKAKGGDAEESKTYSGLLNTGFLLNLKCSFIVFRP